MTEPAAAAAVAVSTSAKTAKASLATRAKDMFGSLTERVQDYWPKSFNTNSWWVIGALAILILLLLSRVITLQRNVSDLQSRPMIDEPLVRSIVRQNLEDTVRSMEQQNKAQMQLRHQQMMEQARRAQELAEAQKADAAAKAAESAKAAEAQKVEEAAKLSVAPTSESVEDDAASRAEEADSAPAPKKKSKKGAALNV